MSGGGTGGGIGPLEPGEGTWDREGTRPEPRTPLPPAWSERPRAFYARHRRAVLTAASLAVLAAAALRIHATRPEPPPALPPSAPSQTLSLAYGEPVEPAPDGAAFAFTVRVRTSAGPPVTVERIGQPSPALTVTIKPRLPAAVAAGEVRELLVLIHTKDCVHVARNSGLPFLEVTLSNGIQKEDHSYIPGDRYARDLSVALTRACPEDRDEPTPSPS
ncbi:Tat pathway signal sequence domain protein [Streptomyces sp. NPDC096033]|uniref:Tat pathway signal sequence domain protein n=1 Tax=Streptomyces sp. NPDC096033 TaxID=3366071 RepID=UPI00381F9F6B